MVKFSYFCYFLLILVAFSFLAKAQHRNKRPKDFQKMQQHYLANQPRSSQKNGNKVNTILKKATKNQLDTPLKRDKNDVLLIPGLGSASGRTILSEWSGEPILQFFDIPYGTTPSGNLRFKAPVPVAAWNHVLNAEKPRHGCPSLQDLVSYEILKSKNIDVEDCLRLTVNTKSVNGNAPVMVYIHGDFLYDGSSLEAAPGYLLEENVVLVSVRYRLGPFGFLSTLSDDIPGNVGVMDVVLALNWIQDHISAFGGDPNRVTLFGQVAGAALINVLTLSPAVPEGLFHRVIYHSSSALSPAFVTDNPLPAARDIGKLAGCKNVRKIGSLNKCLRKLNVTELLEAFRLYSSKRSQELVSFGVQKFVVGGPSGILPQFPAKILASGNFKAYPTMGGSVANGGTFMLRDIYIENLNETAINDNMNGMDYVRLVITKVNGADPTGTWERYAKEEVFSSEILKNGTFYAMIPGLIDLCSTIAFKNPVLLALQGNAQKLPNSTYLYSFDYAGEFNRYTTFEDDANEMPFELGVSLTDDNLFLFPWPRYLLLNSNPDIKVAKRTVALWASFATTGKPSAAYVPQWPPMNDDTGPYMKIDKTVSIEENYIDEFTAAIGESAKGFSLVNEDFFENLIDYTDDTTGIKPYSETLNEEGRGNVVLIAKRTKKAIKLF